MGEVDNLPDGQEKEFLKRLGAAKTVEDVRALRIAIRKAYPAVSDELDELIAYSDERLAEVKKAQLPPGSGRARAKTVGGHK